MHAETDDDEEFPSLPNNTKQLLLETLDDNKENHFNINDNRGDSLNDLEEAVLTRMRTLESKMNEGTTVEKANITLTFVIRRN